MVVLAVDGHRGIPFFLLHLDYRLAIIDLRAGCVVAPRLLRRGLVRPLHIVLLDQTAEQLLHFICDRIFVLTRLLPRLDAVDFSLVRVGPHAPHVAAVEEA